MKPQVAMSPNNAVLCVAVPLFKVYTNQEMEFNAGYEICMKWAEPQPSAFILDIDKAKAWIVSAEWAYINLIFLGDL